MDWREFRNVVLSSVLAVLIVALLALMMRYSLEFTMCISSAGYEKCLADDYFKWHRLFMWP